MGKPLIVIDGRVSGAWRRDPATRVVGIRLQYWVEATSDERALVGTAAVRYGRFFQKDVRVATDGAAAQG